MITCYNSCFTIYRERAGLSWKYIIGLEWHFRPKISVRDRCKHTRANLACVSSSVSLSGLDVGRLKGFNYNVANSYKLKNSIMSSCAPCMYSFSSFGTLNI